MLRVGIVEERRIRPRTLVPVAARAPSGPCATGSTASTRFWDGASRRLLGRAAGRHPRDHRRRDRCTNAGTRIPIEKVWQRPLPTVPLVTGSWPMPNDVPLSAVGAPFVFDGGERFGAIAVEVVELQPAVHAPLAMDDRDDAHGGVDPAPPARAGHGAPPRAPIAGGPRRPRLRPRVGQQARRRPRRVARRSAPRDVRSSYATEFAS